MSSWSEFASDIANAEVREQLASAKERVAMPPDAIPRAIAFAIEQPPDVDEIIVRPDGAGLTKSSRCGGCQVAARSPVCSCPWGRKVL